MSSQSGEAATVSSQSGEAATVSSQSGEAATVSSQSGEAATAPVTVVHLLRHGEVYNPDGVLYGRLPGFRLSERGVEQAHIAAAYLAARPVGYLVSSPMQRAQETAAPLAAALGLEVVTDERLIEAENVFEGKPVAGGKGLFRDVGNWKYFRDPFRPSWGEPYEALAERTHAALLAARDAARAAARAVPGGPEPEAVCVSHQLPIVVLRRHVEGLRLFHDPRARQCSLASVTSFTFVGDVVTRVDYAEPAGPTPAGAVAGA